MKPDLVAPDCVTVPFSHGAVLANNQFCGASAAVPAIAGAATLLESAGFDRVKILKSLRGTAMPLGTATWDPGTAMVSLMLPRLGNQGETDGCVTRQSAVAIRGVPHRDDLRWVILRCPPRDLALHVGLPTGPLQLKLQRGKCGQ
jgi:hypothetical protein